MFDVINEKADQEDVTDEDDLRLKKGSSTSKLHNLQTNGGQKQNTKVFGLYKRNFFE
jgi:hypothetical protein